MMDLAVNTEELYSASSHLVSYLHYDLLQMRCEHIHEPVISAMLALKQHLHDGCNLLIWSVTVSLINISALLAKVIVLPRLHAQGKVSW